MVLSFTPPQDLINAYLNRPSPGEIISDSVNKSLQTYVQAKAQQQAAVLAQQQKDIEMAKGLAANGQDFTDAYNQIVAARTPKQPNKSGMSPVSPAPTSPIPGLSSQATPPPDNFQPQDGSPAVAVNPSGSPIIDHWNASMGASSGGPTPPGGKPLDATGQLTNSPLTDPLVQEYQKDPIAFKKQHGEAGIAKLKAQAEMDKLLQDKSKGPLKTLTKAQALANGTYDPTKEFIVEPPAPRLDLGTKQDQFDQKEWDKIVKDTNPLTASSRTTLGMASKANFQADRALVTLSKPVVTNQEAGNAMADIAAIYQTGSPTQYGMSHQEYSTLYGKIQGALQTITGKPTDALPNAIKDRLVGVLHDMKGTNSLVLKQQLDFTERSKKRIIDKFPDEWKGIRETLESNPDAPGQNIPVISNDKDFAALPSGSQFKDPSGQLHTKK